jgi:hypothetical protein
MVTNFSLGDRIFEPGQHPADQNPQKIHVLMCPLTRPNFGSAFLGAAATIPSIQS